MKRTIVLLAFMYSCSTQQAVAQAWDSLAGGITNTMFNVGPQPYVYGLADYNNSLYACGYFDSAGGTYASGIASWNGSAWSRVGTGLYGFLETLCVYNGKLIAGGVYDSISGDKNVHEVVQWDGKNWSAVGIGPGGKRPYGVSALLGYDSVLYAAGNFDSADGQPAGSIVQWDGLRWSPVGAGITYGTNHRIWAMTICKGKLYVGGTFDSIGGVLANNIAVWDGKKWAALNNGIKGSVYALTVHNNNLYVGGSFDSIDLTRMNNIAIWYGSGWGLVGTGVNDIIASFAIYDNRLIAGGNFDSAGGHAANLVASWNGIKWDSVGSGFPSNNSVINITYSYNSTLYAAGSFSGSGKNSLNNIAQWSLPLAIKNVVVNNADIQVFPNPSNGVYAVIPIAIGSEKLIMNGEIEVYNVLGEKIQSFFIHDSQFSINLGGQPNGVYFYRITNADGKPVASGKLIKE